MLHGEAGGTLPQSCIRVVIAEDQAMVLGALAALLDMEGDIKVVAQVRNGREAFDAVTASQRPGYLRRAIDAGALGYLLKDSPARELADAVRRVHAGHRVINSDLAAEALGEPDPLTDRERQVLRLAGDGMSSEEISKRLGLSDGTVRNYLSEAIGKLGAANRVDASRIARSKGWL
jgi:two-component system response regulator DesR